jgi:SH3-like domain-containing protein
LAFPVKGKGRSDVQSFWGAGRDGGTRKHEGVDIFAPTGTPAIAAANGTIASVSNNKLGGKVIFLHPSGKNYTLYYAHLDAQLVQSGASVQIGDTIGLVGKTGNAIHSSPHLHFGIYTSGGAVDPLPFVDPVIRPAKKITASLALAGKEIRTTAPATINLTSALNLNSSASLPENTVARAEAATDNRYKIVLPDGTSGFINDTKVTAAEKPIRKLKIPKIAFLLDRPMPGALKKQELKAGVILQILGTFKEFYLVKAGETTGWIKKT